MPNPETYNLRQLINNHFFDRDQTKEILENFVTVNNGVLHVGLPEPTNIALTTPNNAITTADMGTLKAKVTGASNVNCYGVPVEFVNKKTQKILGYGLTDLNGEVYHNFRLDDADIFDVQARLSQDYLFNDFGMLNNTHTWNNNSNIVREIYEDHTKIYLDDDTSYGYLCSPVLSGFVDIDFKVKLNDGAITDTFCGLFTTDSSGTVSGALNGFNLGQLGLTSADVGRWVDFHIGVLDDAIVLLCKDTGAMVKLSHTCPSYYIFSFALTGTLTSLDFKGVKINKCSDDLTMFVKDKDFNYLFWDIGVTSNHNDNWVDNGNKGTITRDATGTTLSAQTGKIWVQFFAQSTATFFTNPFTVEFEVVSYTNTPVIRFTDNSANKLHQVSTGIWKITIGTNSITVLKDGQLQSHYLSGLEGKDCKVFFELSENEDVIKYNNFRIYSI